MKKYTFATIAASALAALSIGLATPAVAAPTGPSDDTGGTSQNDNQTNANANYWWGHTGMTPYGTYQNDNPRHSGSRR